MVQRSQSGLSVRGRGGAVVVVAVAVAVCRRVEGGGRVVERRVGTVGVVLQVQVGW